VDYKPGAKMPMYLGKPEDIQTGSWLAGWIDPPKN